MSGLTLEQRAAAAATENEPIDSHDVRWAYDLMTSEQAHASWPCVECGVRRDEHASDPVVSAFPELDITDHPFVPAVDDQAVHA